MAIKRASSTNSFVLTATIRVALGAIFLYTGIAKISQPYAFLSAVYATRLVGPDLGLAISELLPWLELVLGVSLIVGLFDWGPLVWSVVLLSIFSFVKISILRRDAPVPCGCGSETGTPVDLAGTLGTMCLLAIAIAGLVGTCISRYSEEKPSLDAG